MLIQNKHSGYTPDGRRKYYLDMGGGGSPAPDYTPMAEASKESARLGAELGNKQLEENKRQFEINQAAAAPLIAKQGQIMDQSIAQGNDYYDYMKTAQRPVEQAINKEAMAAGSEQLQQEAADRAIADNRAGATSNANMMARQALRYGFSPERMATLAGDQSAAAGLAEATVANGARTAEKNSGFAKRLDAAALYRGLPGASTAALSTASGAGSAGVNSQLGVSGQYMNGMNAGTSTIMQGRQIQQQGLGSILSSQTSSANAAASERGSTNGAVMGAVIQGAAMIL